MVAPALILHAGAGSFRNLTTDPTREGPLRAEIEAVAALQWQRLVGGTAALDVAEAAVSALEDCPDYNAGIGSVLTKDAVVEMDAAIMDGRDRRCGAVGAVRCVRNPVSLARAVMEHSPHVLLVAEGAERFARAQGVELIDPQHLVTEQRQRDLARGLSAAGEQGTVGAVARDTEGHLAAATSTGGTNAQWPGRLGDSPIIGAGTWADDRTCAVSATGFGEVFIRAAFAHSVHAALLHSGVSLAEACAQALAEVNALGGDGGCIALTGGGRGFESAAAFNSRGMLHAWIDDEGRASSAIFR